MNVRHVTEIQKVGSPWRQDCVTLLAMADSLQEMTQARLDRVRSFGPFRMSLREQALFEGGRRLPLGSRAFDVLLALTDRPGVDQKG
jgi:hypothetical protein